MFKNHPDPMRMEPTPERVLAVCKMIEKQPMSKEELVQTMTLGGDNPDVNASINVALEDLHIIDQIDGKLELVIMSYVPRFSQRFADIPFFEHFSDGKCFLSIPSMCRATNSPKMIARAFDFTPILQLDLIDFSWDRLGEHSDHLRRFPISRK